MATKKKTLIELMLDSGVKPKKIEENCNYLVCDVKDEKPVIGRYNQEPVFNEDAKQWSGSRGFISFEGINLTKFCKAWKRTIITKQQFIDAYNKRQKLNELLPKRHINCRCSVIPVETDSLIKNEEKYGLEEAEKLSNDYASLSNVLRRAYDQASDGKGSERHGQDLPFTKQPMQLIQDLVGEGFVLGQAIKKMQESQRLPHDAAIRELLGAINYIAGAIIHKEKENNK